MAVMASRVRKGVFTLQADSEAAPVTFSCDPTAVTLTPTPGDAGDALEVLCGDSVTGEPGATTWELQLTSVQQIESTALPTTSLVLYALDHDGEWADFTFKPGATTLTFYGRCRIVAIPIGGEVGGTAPTSDQTWAMEGAPTTTAPAGLVEDAA